VSPGSRFPPNLQGQRFATEFQQRVGQKRVGTRRITVRDSARRIVHPIIGYNTAPTASAFIES
jgi:hypothetical protein